MNAEAGLPTWRSEVKERVRQYRAQRATAVARAEDPDESPELPPNPVVEAALKRLQRPVEEIPERITQPLPPVKLDPFAPETPSAQARETGLESGNQNAPRMRADAVTGAARHEADPAQTRMLGAMGLQPEARSAGVKEKREVKPTIAIPEPPSAQPPKKIPKIIAPPENDDLYPLPAPQPLNSNAVSLWGRTMAGILDTFLISLAILPFAFFDSAKFAQAEIYSSVGIIAWAVFVYQFWTLLAAGRTPGMAWQNMRVVESASLSPRLPFWRVLMRSLAATISFLLPPLNVIVIWTSGNQASICDLVSGTTLRPDHQSDGAATATKRS